nr:MAG TPA: hypothetical protein [Caudoviricetes sp.]
MVVRRSGADYYVKFSHSITLRATVWSLSGSWVWSYPASC